MNGYAKGKARTEQVWYYQLTKAIVMISTTQHELIKGSHVYVFESATAECEVHKCQLSSDDVRADGFMPVSLLT